MDSWAWKRGGREREKEKLCHRQKILERDQQLTQNNFFKIDLFEQLLYFCQISSLLLFFLKEMGMGVKTKRNYLLEKGTH